jgi:hypothetical protein
MVVEGELTARRVVNTIIRYGVDEESRQTDHDCDEPEGEYPTQRNLLALAKLQAVDDEERKDKYCIWLAACGGQRRQGANTQKIRCPVQCPVDSQSIISVPQRIHLVFDRPLVMLLVTINDATKEKLTNCLKKAGISMCLSRAMQ